jgi:hypothetical protein
MEVAGIGKHTSLQASVLITTLKIFIVKDSEKTGFKSNEEGGEGDQEK